MFILEKIITTKPNPDTKLGIRYSVTPSSGAFIEEVKDGGLFANTTTLEKGQFIYSINGTLTNGLSIENVAKVLQDITDIIVIKTLKKLSYIKRDEVPTFLQEKTPKGGPVSIQTWQTIFDLVQFELLPAISKAKEMDEKFESSMRNLIQI